MKLNVKQHAALSRGAPVRMGDINVPKGWNNAKVRRVLAHYEKQTAEDAVREDETGVGVSETVMSVPRDLVPKVRELIAKRHR